MKLVLLILLFPATAAASDYTALYFIFLELPIFAVSCLLFALCFAAPKAGTVLCTLLLIGTFFVVVWASDVGYMSDAGGLLLLSFLVDLGGMTIGVKKMNEVRNQEARLD